MKRLGEPTGGRISFRVKLQPRSTRDEIVGWTEEGVLKVRVTAPPVDQAANRGLVRLLSRELDVPRSEILLKSGRSAGIKRLEVPAECKNRLSRYPDI